MTKHPQKLDSATTPCNSVVLHGAGAPEVEITPAMMEAGENVMLDWYAGTWPPEWAVSEIYEAMERARLKLPLKKLPYQESDKAALAAAQKYELLRGR